VVKRRLSHLPALGDGTVLIGLLARGPRVLDLADYIHTIDNLTEDDMLVVQEGRRHRGDEELATVGVWAGVLRALSALMPCVLGRKKM